MGPDERNVEGVDVIGAGDRWIPRTEYAAIAARVPIVCVDVLPLGRDSNVGLILRKTSNEDTAWCLVGGAVLRDEPLAMAVERHLRATLPEMRIVSGSLRVGAIGEYFTRPGIGEMVDPRKHAVSITYTAECEGGVRSAGEALEFRWFPRSELDGGVTIGFGQASVIRKLLGALRSADTPPGLPGAGAIEADKLVQGEEAPARRHSPET